MNETFLLANQKSESKSGYGSSAEIIREEKKRYGLIFPFFHFFILFIKFCTVDLYRRLVVMKIYATKDQLRRKYGGGVREAPLMVRITHRHL